MISGLLTPSRRKNAYAIELTELSSKAVLTSFKYATEVLRGPRCDIPECDAFHLPDSEENHAAKASAWDFDVEGKKDFGALGMKTLHPRPACIEMCLPKLTGRTDDSSDGPRYAAVSLNPIGKYGTLEFRQFQATNNPATLQSWLVFLLHFVGTFKALELGYFEPYLKLDPEEHLPKIDLSKTTPIIKPGSKSPDWFQSKRQDPLERGLREMQRDQQVATLPELLHTMGVITADHPVRKAVDHLLAVQKLISGCDSTKGGEAAGCKPDEECVDDGQGFKTGTCKVP